jgi:uncharacterized phiE125 gp8 family phage protein
MAGFISLADAKAQLRVRSAGEDGLIQDLINAAGLAVERRTGFVAGEREETFHFDSFGRALELRLRPVQVDTIEISYLDIAGESQVLTDFRIVERHGTIRILPAIGNMWPSAICFPGAVTVTAKVGFAASDEAGAADAPANVLHAVRVCVAKWFNDREEGLLPPAFDQLLDDERLRRV